MPYFIFLWSNSIVSEDNYIHDLLYFSLLGSLKGQFGKLLKNCLDKLQGKGISVDEVKCIVREEYTADGVCCIQSLLDESEDIYDIFISLTVHGIWDCINPSLLKKISFTLLTKENEICEQVTEYIRKQSSLSLCNFLRVGLSGIRPPLISFVNCTAQIDLPEGEINSFIISSLSCSIKNHLDVRKDVLLLKVITKNPWKLTWIIPKAFLKRRVCSDLKWLREKKIASISFDEEKVG